MMELLQMLQQAGQDLLGPVWLPLWTVVKIMAIVVPIMLAIAYLTLAERKVIGYMQIRIGPNRVGPYGLLQPIADGVKLLFKEIIIPTGSSKFLFVLAPIMALAPSLAAWAVVPFGDGMALANLNAGLLYLLAMEESVLLISAKSGVAKAADLAAAMPGLTPAQRTYQIKKLVERKMLQPIKEGARQYTIGFSNNYLMRGVVRALSNEGFIPATLNKAD